MTISKQFTYSLTGLSDPQLQAMLTAGAEVRRCYRLLQKNETYGNIVREILRDQGTFTRFNHYPTGDVHDRDTHSQYFYHAHRGLDGENGHFHTFLRAKGMPDNVSPAPYTGNVEWPEGDDALSHIIAISMDPRGYPIGLFSTNRWVTGETFYNAEHVVQMLDRFEMDLLYPSWPVNIWITSTMRLFRPQIEWLLRLRDQTISDWALAHPDKDVYEDRELEITSEITVDVDQQIQRIETELAKRNSTGIA
ncbi:hypothetical protein AB833_23450 [Chromatiales bacterium (ex Bugula neritina AB1)]|nr:hypothetical protein AB833_23450 [Chromatiales bacterium (ex Bugula neritina AB1)]